MPAAPSDASPGLPQGRRTLWFPGARLTRAAGSGGQPAARIGKLGPEVLSGRIYRGNGIAPRLTRLLVNTRTSHGAGCLSGAHSGLAGYEAADLGELSASLSVLGRHGSPGCEPVIGGSHNA